MRNTDHPNNEEEQFAAIPTDYRALMAMTRPLIITERALPSWRGGEVCRSGLGMPPGPEGRGTELALRRGEIFGSDEWDLRTPNAEELTTTREDAGTSSAPEVEDASAEYISALHRRDSHLQIRICLGMS
jgi:hypothetical protein